MNKSFVQLIVCFITLGPCSQVFANDLIERFQIEQGVAKFTQEKVFSFLNTPIKSSGILKINKSNILWQVNKPVFSKLLIIDSQIFQYEEVKTSEGVSNFYRKITTHASIETLIQAIFTGNIDKEEWNVTEKEQCLLLEPKDTILVQAISLLELCINEQGDTREVLITDTQKNTTKISLIQSSKTLSDDDINEFNIH